MLFNLSTWIRILRVKRYILLANGKPIKLRTREYFTGGRQETRLRVMIFQTIQRSYHIDHQD